MIAELERASRPVYVEIDDESNVITNVRVPRVLKVERLDPDEHGNLLVRLQPSSAIHLLLRSNPQFESMRDSLTAAMGDGSERLITETRDEHEIIDVREVDRAEAQAGPGPSSSTDPPVSEARAGELFSSMNGRSCDPSSPSSDCITFLYPDDGCWIRAHMMSLLMREGGPDTTTNPPEDPEKVWIDFVGSRSVPTANHPDCHVGWGWHVAPTLLVTLPGGDEKRVIDPSLCSAPVSVTDWRNLQDPTAAIQEGPWSDYNLYEDDWGPGVSLATANQHLQQYRDELRDRCLDIGPPPYSCSRGTFFIIDRNTFSEDEVAAMLHAGSPALVEGAFYIVADGFSPYELGLTSATMGVTPALSLSATVPGMTVTPVRLEFEYPTHLNRRQRLTWVYDISFADTTGFTEELITVRMDATVSSAFTSASGSGYLYLIKQPNPYEIDGATSWLSTDLRVFQIQAGQSRFGVAMGSDPSAFITQVIANLNAGSTGGQTFDGISVDQQTSRLELSQTVDGTPVYNFAVAKVRYRAEAIPATDVRVFFRLFPAATTSLNYDQGTTYRRHEAGGHAVPLLGIQDGRVVAIPCFASPRIDSAAVSMADQTDAPNVQTIPPNPSGAEVTRYFGCWLDLNQPQPQFPLHPSPLDGPYPSGRSSVLDLIRNEHQCLVSEIAFAPTPIPGGSTPAVSDKLAQRNLAIVESANPGLAFSRRIPQTFEIRPSGAGLEHDELMIDWGNVPAGTVATLYLPGFDADEILSLAAKKYRSHRLVRIDRHTLKTDSGGITYLPIPASDGTWPGLLTVDLPEGVVKGQAFKVVVRQVTPGRQAFEKSHVSVSEGHLAGWKHIVGAFQLTIPVRDKADMLPRQERLLSNLRWIERSIPENDRWSPVFSRYVTQIAHRVDALGGDSSKVAPSASGQWREAYRACLLLSLVTALLVAMTVIGLGALTGALAGAAAVLLLALSAGMGRLWMKRCRPTACKRLKVLLAGTGAGTLVLALLALFGISTPQLIPVLAAGAGLTLVAAFAAWKRGCFRA